jgi:hypothetical protein
VHATGYQHAEVEQLMTVAAHVEGARLAPFGDSRHVEKGAKRVNHGSQNQLVKIWEHHQFLVTIKRKANC